MKQWSILLLFILSISCQKKVEKTNPTLEAISESVYASGIVKSKNQYQVYSTVNGLIQIIYVNEGDLVHKGDPIMKVSNVPSKLNAYNAQLAAEYSDLQANKGKLAEAKATINFAQSKMKNDSLLMVRQKALHAQGVGSMVDMEQRELAYQNSLTNYEIALLHYQDLQRQLEFSSHQSKTNLQISQSLAGDYIIKAEADGKVYKILKEKGEFANTINPVAILGDADEFVLEMKIDEYDISRISPDQLVLFTMDSYSGEVFKGSVAKIEPLMNEQSRSFTVTANLITKPQLLYPNLSIEANVIIRSKEKVLTIPRNYLIGDTVVMVKNKELRKVEVGIKDYQKAEIKNGLTPTDVIYKPAL